MRQSQKVSSISASAASAASAASVHQQNQQKVRKSAVLPTSLISFIFGGLNMPFAREAGLSKSLKGVRRPLDGVNLLSSGAQASLARTSPQIEML